MYTNTIQPIRGYSTIERVYDPKPELAPVYSSSFDSACNLSDDTSLLNGLTVYEILFLVIDFMRQIDPTFGLSEANKAIEYDCKSTLKIATRQYNLVMASRINSA